MFKKKKEKKKGGGVMIGSCPHVPVQQTYFLITLLFRKRRFLFSYLDSNQKIISFQCACSVVFIIFSNPCIILFSFSCYKYKMLTPLFSPMHTQQHKSRSINYKNAYFNVVV